MSKRLPGRWDQKAANTKSLLALYCTLMLITMHSHQSYPNITTVIHSYEVTSIVLLSIIVPSRHTRIGAWVNSTLVCVCVFSSHPFWTSSSLDVPAGVTQEEGHTGFLIHLPSAVRALIFVARRIQPFLSLVDREVEFCVLTN